MRKKNKEIHVLKMFIIVIAVSGVLIALFSYGSFLPGNVTVQNGTYLYTGTGKLLFRMIANYVFANLI